MKLMFQEEGQIVPLGQSLLLVEGIKILPMVNCLWSLAVNLILLGIHLQL